MMLGRLLHTAYTRLRLLVGITTYLFIIAGGYYQVFALIAGQYFVFLIFILGLLFFFLEHFKRGGPAAAGAPKAGGTYPTEAESVDKGKIKHLLGVPTLNPVERNELEHEYKVINQTLEDFHAFAKEGGRIDTAEVARLRKAKAEIERKLYGKYYSSN